MIGKWLVFLLKDVIRRFFSLVLVGFLYVFVTFIEVFVLWKKPGWCATRKKDYKNPRMISTATLLKESGVTFKKKEKIKCFLDVSFKDGTMLMPQVSIEQHSNSVFRNFLALEQFCPKLGHKFTSYIVLMDNLIDTASDVAILQKSGIIESKLGCNDDVAKFFNAIRGGTFLTFDEHYLRDLFQKVNKYSDLEHNRWRAKLLGDYFDNPWAIISLVGAIVLLGLTAVQAAYAIISTNGSKKTA